MLPVSSDASTETCTQTNSVIFSHRRGTGIRDVEFDASDERVRQVKTRRGVVREPGRDQASVLVAPSESVQAAQNAFCIVSSCLNHSDAHDPNAKGRALAALLPKELSWKLP